MEFISNMGSAATSIAKDFIPRVVGKASNADNLFNVDGGNIIGKRHVGFVLESLADALGVTLDELLKELVSTDNVIIPSNDDALLTLNGAGRGGANSAGNVFAEGYKALALGIAGLGVGGATMDVYVPNYYLSGSYLARTSIPSGV